MCVPSVAVFNTIYICNVLILFPFNFRPRGETAESRIRRVCRFGAGTEQVAYAKDTTGFKNSDYPTIVNDIRGFKRLDLKRSHPRILQSSLHCVRSWRANCDVQILLYDGNPNHPSPAEIAKATDYIVGYACKGNESLKMEKALIRQLILNATETHGDDTDVTRVARQILNQSIGEKMISKQEAMVQIGQLQLFDCSESIDTHSLSGYRKLHKDSNGKYSGSTLLAKYANRAKRYETTSLYDYYFISKHGGASPDAKSIPHFVGARSHPTYPITPQYARSTLMLHHHWRPPFPFSEETAKEDFQTHFETFPMGVKIPFECMKARDARRHNDYELVNRDSYGVDGLNFHSPPKELEEILQLVSTLPKRSKDVDNDIGTLNLGLSHDWTQQTYTLPMSFQDTITFLTRKVKEYESSLTSRKLSIPRKTCGTIYSISFLRKDQRCVMAVVVHNLFQWLYAKTYNPLRMTVSGVAGSGKSTLIQTIVATVRTMFQ